MEFLPVDAHIQQKRTIGFTMIELIIVIVLLGILVTFIAPRLGGITPKYRLRSFARNTASLIEKTRVTAIVRGKTTGIRYVLDDGSGRYRIHSSGGVWGSDSENTYYAMALPPAPLDYPDLPLEERYSQLVEVAPPGIRILRVILPGAGEVTSGAINIAFSPSGTIGSHILVLEADFGDDSESQVMSLKYNSISGILDFYSGEVLFEHRED